MIHENMKTMLAGLGVSVLLASSLTFMAGCSSSASSEKATPFEIATTGTAAENVAANIETAGYGLEYSKRDADASYSAKEATTVVFAEDGATVEGEGASAEGSVVSITAEGTYVLSGSSADGQVVVEVAEDAKVQLVLNGLELSCNSGPCIYVKEGDKVFVTLADGSTNVLKDGSGWQLSGEDGEANATLYSECDLTINGQGSLEVEGTVHHGISTKDDLTITGGTISVKAADDGLHGKDSVQINGGTISVDAQGDAIKCTEADKADKGFVSIDGGTLNLKAGDDGMQSTQLIRFTGGTTTITSADDALNCDIDIQVADGELVIDAGDDALHGEYNVSVEGGTITVNTCAEGFEGQCVEVAGGTNYIAASDDGINASAADTGTDAGADGSAQNASGQQNASAPQQAGQRPERPQGDRGPRGSSSDGQQNSSDVQGQQQGGRAPQDAQASQGEQALQDNKGMQGGQGMPGGGGMDQLYEECNVTISGGTTTLVCTRDGDSIDSNGYFNMTGGTVYISGTTGNGNGALDAAGESTITGGQIIALASAGMVETFSSSSTQASVVATPSGKAGDKVSITDEAGKELISYTAVNDYAWLLASTPELAEGTTYKVVVNGKEATTLTASITQQGSGMQGVPGGKQGGQPA